MNAIARQATLDDKYVLERGQIFLTGIQALVRLPLDIVRRDRRAGTRHGGLHLGLPRLAAGRL